MDEFKATHKIIGNDVSQCWHCYDIGEEVMLHGFNGTEYEEDDEGNVYVSGDGTMQFVMNTDVEEIK